MRATTVQRWRSRVRLLVQAIETADRRWMDADHGFAATVEAIECDALVERVAEKAPPMVRRWFGLMEAA